MVGRAYIIAKCKANSIIITCWAHIDSLDRDNDRSYCKKKRAKLHRKTGAMLKSNIFWALLAIGMIAALSGEAIGQALPSKAGFLGEFKKKSIVGSWQELVRFPSDAPLSQQRSVTTFHDDGTIIASGQGFVIYNADLTKAMVESDGIGAWAQIDWRTFGYTVFAVLSDLNGNLTGFFKVRVFIN